MEIPYAKYQALGNSFVIIDEIYARGRLKKFERLAIDICDPSYGIGADGIMVISQAKDSLRLDIYNSDGSWAEKSGNGIRVGAMHLLNRGHISGGSIELLTGSGLSTVVFHRGSEKKRHISASLGRPEFRSSLIPVKTGKKYFINQSVKCGGRSFVASAVSVGNPHLVMFCDDFEFDWEMIGSLLEKDALFPHRINVGFVVVKSESEIEARDWERGAGPTGSSGTGAGAAVSISVMRGFTSRHVKVQTMAGTLIVNWDEPSDQLFIKGPVEHVCSGIFNH
jgi:diaminopimelate epimerase